VHVAKRPGEPDLTHADINRARKVLNWDPKINLEQGIAKVLETKEAWAGAPIWSAEEIEIVTADWFKFLQR
jgi:UDP-glucose 4-epimerase